MRCGARISSAPVAEPGRISGRGLGIGEVNGALYKRAPLVLARGRTGNVTCSAASRPNSSQRNPGAIPGRLNSTPWTNYANLCVTLFALEATEPPNMVLGPCHRMSLRNRQSSVFVARLHHDSKTLTAQLRSDYACCLIGCRWPRSHMSEEVCPKRSQSRTLT